MGSNIHTRELSLFLIISFLLQKMASVLFRLFVVLLGLSYLLSLQAIPITRTENLMQGPLVHDVISENTDKIATERNAELEEPNTVTERMDLELHDYPPSGANNRHTPRAP
ncbi:uncharacterized protein LOC114744356 isoform X1 [Neltuma alba]|uniref:uncharacterized protein LOC114744356 isoform X1 n=2 Tax=Neltuma alba TaxID=207710 RepID=UPI0010A307C0|nr:uncharacterized protein LOC114744356 isoform X1 [Prosopis alba]